MLTIAQVERETGLSKDVLRVWERRYGFPQPVRDAGGDRLYSPEEVERLRLAKRLLDQGVRPGRLFATDPSRWGELAPLHKPVEVEAGVLKALVEDDAEGLRRELARLLAQHGVQRFVQDIVPGLNEEIGNAWAAGRLAVHQEHLYSEALGRLLRGAIGQMPAGDRPPRVLLTTLPAEEHGLGILMVETLLTTEGAPCVNLGRQTPLEDLVRAVRAYGIDVVVLSFSAAYPPRLGLADLRRLGQALPPGVEVWAGGAMSRGLVRRSLPRVTWTPELADCLRELERWRRERGV